MAPAGTGALVAECDPSGGDVGAWAQLPPEPGWATAVAAPQRSWAAIRQHTQALPNGLRVMTSSTRSSLARIAVTEAASTFAPLLAASPDVLVVADCGRLELRAPTWAVPAQLTLLLLRQASSAPATVARVDRAIEALDVLTAACPRVGVVLIGAAPYPPAEVEAALGVAAFGTLPEDAAGAGLVCGGWTLGPRRGEEPARASAAAVLARRTVDAVAGVPGLVDA